MRGRELTRELERLGVGAKELTARLGLPPGRARGWKRGRVPRRWQRPVRWALWTLEGQRLWEHSGLPRCEWEPPRGRDGEVDLDAALRHGAGCPVCQERRRYVEERLGPMPSPGGILGWLGWIGDRLGWTDGSKGAAVASVAGGVGIALFHAALPILFFLAQGLILLETGPLWRAVGTFSVSLAGGAAGGYAHHVLRPVRARGGWRHYAAWVMAVWACLWGVLWTLTAAYYAVGRAVGGGAWEEVRAILAAPAWWIAFLLAAPLYGLFLARVARREGVFESPVAAGTPRPTRLIAGRKLRYGVVSLVCLLVAGQWVQGRLRESRTDRAIARLAARAEARPDEPAARHLLAWTLAREGRFERALSEYRAALDLEPDARLYRGLAYVLAGLGRFDEAVAAVDSAILLAPEVAEYHGYRATVLAYTGHYGQALPAARAAVLLDSTEATYWGLLGRLEYLGAMDHERALEAYERATRLDATYFRENPMDREIRDELREAARGGAGPAPAGEGPP